MAAHEFTDACSAEPVTLAQTMVALEATQVERSAALRALDGNVNAEDRFRVLSSGILAYRLPPTAHGREVWFDPVKRVKLCKHGYTMAQIHHWRCPARPRTRPPWVECTCQDAKGLYVDPLAKPDLTNGALVPPYHRVLWRDGEPTRLDYKGILAVRVPGYPKGHEVYVDAYGTTRCPQCFTESTLRHRRQRQEARAATLLQRSRCMRESERSRMHLVRREAMAIRGGVEQPRPARHVRMQRGRSPTQPLWYASTSQAGSERRCWERAVCMTA